MRPRPLYFGHRSCRVARRAADQGIDLQQEPVLQFNAQQLTKPQVYALFGRLALYTLAIFALMVSLPTLFDYGGFAWFVEHGVVEWFQFGLLATTALALLAAALARPAFRQVLLLISAGVGFAAIRELDALFDRIVPHIGWKFALALPVAALVYVARRWRGCRHQFRWFLFTPSFFLFWAGFVVAVPVAQMLGNGDLLQEIMGASYQGRFKRVIEETGESIGYVILFFGGVEALVNTRQTRVVEPAALDRPPGD